MKKHTLAVALVVALSAPSLSVASPSSVPATVAEAEVGLAVGRAVSRTLNYARVWHNSKRLKRNFVIAGAVVGGLMGMVAGGHGATGVIWGAA